VREAVVSAVRDRPIVVHRGEDIRNGMENVIQAIDIKYRILLSCERRVGQVLRRRRRAHGERRPGVAIGERPVVPFDLFDQLGRELGARHPAADRGARLGQCAHVSHVKRFERVLDACAEIVVFEELAKRVGRRRKAAGNAYAGGRELTDHLAEGSVLAADLREIAHADTLEGNDANGLGHAWRLEVDVETDAADVFGASAFYQSGLAIL
jgi:hypothetical protein